MHLLLQWKDTALMLAYDHGHIECVKMLLDKGAQVNMPDRVSLCGVCTCNAARMQVPSCE